VRVAIFSAQSYERTLLDELNAGHRHELVYFDTLLGPGTASLAAGFPAVSVSVNDAVTADVLQHLAASGTQLVATRSTGFNHIDVRARGSSASSCASSSILPTPWPSVPSASSSR
jgi:D-lactate dehydrogenase